MGTTLSLSKFLSAAILCLAVGTALGDDVLEGNYNVTAFCTAVKTGTNLGSIVSCDYYYVCTSTGPQKAYCSSGYAFSLSTGSCTPVAQANCYYGVENPCLGRTGESWVPVTGTCNQYYYCLDGVNKGQGSCKGTQSFDKVSQQCVYGNCIAGSVDNDEPNLTNICEVVPYGKYFGDTQACDTWNYCQTNGTLQSNKCSSAYNVETGECVYANDNVCSRVTDTPLGTAPTQCDTSGDVKPNDKICGSYYTCKGQTWVSVDCAYGYYYNVGTKSCVLRKTATPVAGCNRCQYATTTWVNAVSSTTCGTYYYCNNGQASLQTCQDKYYFNENQQGCLSTSDTTSFDTYVKNNGACAGATVSDDSETTTESEVTAIPKFFDTDEETGQWI
ncbi:peritrophin-48 [Drosophila persimilis]|uniref:peritrophin-48 n=1 Tax=Drosophila persimilis TaxID=7234 RepID=UPI000F0986B1|nr:peritrophin-48 [Drosophila persimilis]